MPPKTQAPSSPLEMLQKLIQIPSLSGDESELARFVQGEMKSLGYEVKTDQVGNVIGTIRGTGAAEPLIFNTHLDHVDVGDHSGWPHPPYGGELHGGSVWGRGAVDIKGPMAAQICGVAALARGGQPPGDIHVTCVVQEEIGGIGTRHLLLALRAPVVVVGEPSSNQIRRGHRGRTEIRVRIRGRSVHASVPDKGINPLFSMARFLSRLSEVPLAHHEELGESTVAPTLISTDQTSGNVVPAEVSLVCDWRNVPGENAEDARQALERIANQAAEKKAKVEVEIPIYKRRTYTHEIVRMPADNPAYILAADDPVVVATREIASEVLGRDEEPGFWHFATDGGHFAAAGMSPVGFGPGDESLAHTVKEHIEIGELVDATRVNEKIARELMLRLE